VFFCRLLPVDINTLLHIRNMCGICFLYQSLAKILTKLFSISLNHFSFRPLWITSLITCVKLMFFPLTLIFLDCKTLNLCAKLLFSINVMRIAIDSLQVQAFLLFYWFVMSLSTKGKCYNCQCDCYSNCCAIYCYWCFSHE